MARDTFVAALDAGWADPARLHREGRQANHLLQTGRAVLADGLGCSPESVSLHPSPAQASRQRSRGCDGPDADSVTAW